jgi:hypothetical protein
MFCTGTEALSTYEGSATQRKLALPIFMDGAMAVWGSELLFRINGADVTGDVRKCRAVI